MINKTKVSVVLCSVDRLPWIIKVVDQLKIQETQSFKFEIILVIGPTKDETLEHFSNDPDIVLIHFTDRNLSMARNIGVNAASGSIIAFIDDDAIPERTWLANLIQPIMSERAQITGGKTFHLGTTIIQHTQSIQNLIFGHRQNPVADYNHLLSIEFPSFLGANFAISKKVAEAINGFDHKFRWFLDESDFLYRAFKAGFRFEYVDNAVVHHAIAPSALRKSSHLYTNFEVTFFSIGYFLGKNSLPQIALSEILDCLVYERMTETISNNSMAQRQNIYSKEEVSTYRQQITQASIAGFCEGIATYRRENIFDGLNVISSLPHKRITGGKEFANEEVLKIAFVVNGNYTPGTMGGIAKWILSNAPHLANQENEVHIFLNANGMGATKVDLVEGVWMHQIASDVEDLWMPNVAGLPYEIQVFCRKLQRYFIELDKRLNFDIIVVPIFEAIGTIFLDDPRLVTTLMTDTEEYLRSNSWIKDSPSLYFKRIMPLIAAEKRVLREGRNFHAISHAIAKQLILNENAVIGVFPPGIGEEIEVVPVPKRTPAALYVGRFEARKGIDVLLEAWVASFPSKSNRELRICGNAGMDYLQLVIADLGFSLDQFCEKFSVVILGEVNEIQLEREYSECSFVVIPSRFESFGLVMGEAFRHGTPVLGSNVGGLGEFLSQGGGLLFENENISDLTHKINQIYNSQELREELSKQALARFRSELSFSKYASKSVEFYNQVRNLAGTNGEFI